MRCPYCGSEELVWDCENGAVVCSSCGCIVDTIYVSQPRAGGRGGSSRATEKLYRFEKRLRRKVVGKALKRFELEKRGYIFVNGRAVHLRSLAALKNTELNSDVKKLVDEGLKVLQQVAPSLSRTIRSRLALAYAVAKLLRGEEASLNELRVLFSIGRTTAVRIVKEAEEILQQFNSLHISEPRKPYSLNQ
jgi:ribosomal protein S27E